MRLPPGSRKLGNDFGSAGLVIGTPGQGFFFGYTEKVATTAGNTAISSTGNNVVTLTPMTLLASYIIRHTTFNLITGVDGTTANFGLYDANGNLVFDSGAFSTPIAAGGTTLTLVHSAVFIPAGVYDFAQACTATTVTANNCSPAAPTSIQQLFSKNVPNRMLGHATNQLAAGALPATTGARLAGGSSPTLVLFEP